MPHYASHLISVTTDHLARLIGFSASRIGLDRDDETSRESISVIREVTIVEKLEGSLLHDILNLFLLL